VRQTERASCAAMKDGRSLGEITGLRRNWDAAVNAKGRTAGCCSVLVIETLKQVWAAMVA
jgi:hypothetical protein